MTYRRPEFLTGAERLCPGWVASIYGGADSTEWISAEEADRELFGDRENRSRGDARERVVSAVVRAVNPDCELSWTTRDLRAAVKDIREFNAAIGPPVNARRLWREWLSPSASVREPWRAHPKTPGDAHSLDPLMLGAAHQALASGCACSSEGEALECTRRACAARVLEASWGPGPAGSAPDSDPGAAVVALSPLAGSINRALTDWAAARLEALTHDPSTDAGADTCVLRCLQTASPAQAAALTALATWMDVSRSSDPVLEYVSMCADLICTPDDGALRCFKPATAGVFAREVISAPNKYCLTVSWGGGVFDPLFGAGRVCELAVMRGFEDHINTSDEPEFADFGHPASSAEQPPPPRIFPDARSALLGAAPTFEEGVTSDCLNTATPYLKEPLSALDPQEVLSFALPGGAGSLAVSATELTAYFSRYKLLMLNARGSVPESTPGKLVWLLSERCVRHLAARADHQARRGGSLGELYTDLAEAIQVARQGPEAARAAARVLASVPDNTKSACASALRRLADLAMAMRGWRVADASISEPWPYPLRRADTRASAPDSAEQIEREVTARGILFAEAVEAIPDAMARQEIMDLPVLSVVGHPDEPVVVFSAGGDDGVTVRERLEKISDAESETACMRMHSMPLAVTAHYYAREALGCAALFDLDRLEPVFEPEPAVPDPAELAEAEPSEISEG